MLWFAGLRTRYFQFIGFVFLSGLGWLCDIASFTLLVELFGAPGFVANFVSSYVGVTFVWFTSLRSIFGRPGAVGGRFLLIYWGFQFVSILAYSQVLQLVVDTLRVNPSALLANTPEIAAKIIVTPFNLVTNFLFMKFLTRHLQHAESAHV